MTKFNTSTILLTYLVIHSSCLVLLPSTSDDIEDLTTPSQDSLLANNLVEFLKQLKELSKGNLIETFGMRKNDVGSENPAADLARYNAGLTNEDIFLNATELIKKYKYPVEIHEVQTPDGYVLTIVRMPRIGPPVLLMHGLFLSCDDFLTSGPDDGLAYLLYNAGYDVWMGNARGNKYSRKHISLSPQGQMFWNFSWHEIGIYDLPTIIDLILEKVDKPKLYYVGHSQGTTASYVMLSQKPEYNDKICVLVSLSPVAYMKHLVSPVLRALTPFRNKEYFLLNTIECYELLPSDEFTRLITLLLCGTSVLASTVCTTIYSPLLGFDYLQTNFTDAPVQFNHFPSGSATKQLLHYLQEIDSGHFEQFDYGKERNMEIYGSESPPDYDIGQITAKVALFYSDNDFLSSPIDVEKLALKLPNLVLYYKVPLPFAHLDYIWGKNVEKLIFRPIIELFQQLQC